jgi:RHS repeat-associated protein
MIKGDCSGCGGTGEFAVMGYDAFGRLVRKQDAMGEITEWSYDFMGRVSEKKEGYTLDSPACVPLGSPYCYVTGEAELMDGSTVLYDAGVTPTTFTYDDWDWRYRPTEVCRDSLIPGGDESCRSFEYDTETGVTLSEVDSGWTWDHATSAAKREQPTTQTELYDGSSVARFNPATEAALIGVTGLTFQKNWADFPQPAGLVAEVDGPLLLTPEGQDITEYVYYPKDAAVPSVLQGRLAAMRDPTGNVTFYDGYDAHGRVTRLIDSRGVRTDFTYDALGRVLTETVLGNCNTDFGFDQDPNCNVPLVTTYTYEATTGPLASVTPPSGASVTVYGYDGWGRTETVSRGNSGTDLRERVLYDYDAVHRGRVSSEKLQEPDGGGDWDTRKETEYAYQGFGRLYQTIYPRFDGDALPPFGEYTYDAAGNVLSFADGYHDSANVTYTYDVHGRLVMVRNLYEKVGDTELWAVTQYEYDANDNLILVRDAEEFETTYSVDDFGQTYIIDSPATGITELTYDVAGRLRSRKDARGVEEIRVYDLSGRLKQSDFTLGEEKEKTIFDYQKGYEVQSTAEHPDGSRTTQSRRYDRRGLVLESTQDNEKTVRFEYDADGHLVKRNRGICELLTNEVDWAGRPERITVMPPDCGGQQVIADGVEYLPFGPPTFIRRRQGGDYSLEENLGYDLQYRMISQDFKRTGSGAATLIERWYGTPGLPDGYDGAGNLLLVNDSAMPERNRVYTYDEMSRLIGAAAPQSIGELKYTYDLVGNRTKYEFGEKDPPENSDDSTYDSGTGLLSQITEFRAGSGQVSYSLTHDEVGNLAAESDPSNQTYSYNLRNQLVDHNGLLSFVYDAHGRQVKSVRDLGMLPEKTVTHYLLPDGRPYLDVPYSQAASAPQWSYAYLGDRLLARFDNTRNFEHVVSDHIGFPLATIDNEGSVLWQPDPQPFGTIHAEESVGDGHDPLIRYPGQWAHDPFLVATEPEFSTLYYNFHRWYKPGWGRYTQADPVGILSTRGGLAELYAYGYGNPTRFIDPEGLDVRVCCRPLQPLPSYDHCYVESDGSGRRRTWGLYQQHGWAVYRMNDPDDVGGDCGPWTPDECGDVEDCIQKKAQNYPLLRYPFAGFGRNSNTFARCVSESCGVTTPKSVHEDAPFWGFRCPPGQTSQ